MLTFSVRANVNDLLLPKTDGGVEVNGVHNINDVRPQTDKGKQWWSEYWDKSLEGLEKKTELRRKTKGQSYSEINVDAFGYKCEKNETYTKESREINMITMDEQERGERGVADTVAYTIDANYDSILEGSEVSTLVEEFLYIHDELMVSEGVNLWKVMIMASKDLNIKMLDKLRDLMERHNLHTLIEGVLKNAQCMKQLKGVMEC